MTDDSDRHPAENSPRTEKEIAEALRLRSDPPSVKRLSRKAITVLVGVGGLSLGAVLIVALQSPEEATGPTELFSTERVQEAEGLTRLPRDYSAVPQLGPPLPGELGRPVLSAQQRGEPVPVGPVQPSALSPEQQARLQEENAARLAALFTDVRTSTVNAGTAPVQPQTPTPTLSQQSLFPTAPASANAPDAIDRREAFLDEEVDRRTTAADRLQNPMSPYVLKAGSVVEAALVTGIRSDLPGQITAQVTANVYDSPTGRFLLIPQGARLIGEYDSRISEGQRRLLLAWTRLILPDGRSIVLEREPGTDEGGYAGLEDRVDNHWDQLFLAAGLTTILNIGLETGEDGDDDIANAIRDGAQETFGRAGEQIVSQQLSIPPTLTIRPGFPVRMMVTRDLILEPLGAER